MSIIIIIFIIFINFISPRIAFAQTCQPEQKFNFENGKCEKIVQPKNAVLVGGGGMGDGWECQVGFKKIASKNICQKVIVPEHAKLNYSGDDFACERGFERIDSGCSQIIVPENGVLEASGNDWICIATYKREGDKCVKVELPKDAKFFNQGFDWYCNNQFRKEGGDCKKFEIPANAHLNFMGDDWQCNKGFVKNREKNSCDSLFIPLNSVATLESFECDPGYDKQGDACVKVDPIEHGKFYEHDNQFYCENGYIRSEELNKCIKVEVPANSYADSSSLEGWNCCSGYIKNIAYKSCDKFTLPENAEWRGDFWVCKVGYRKISEANTCEKVSIPEHAHAVESFDGWVCDIGYAKNYKENRCEAVN